jgi:hemophore-related protein
VIKLSLSGLAVAVSALAVSFAAGAGVASAEPDLGPAVNSTCSYPQFVAALHAQMPKEAAEFDASPATQALLRQFIASPPSQRVVLARALLNQPGADQAVPAIQQIFSVCNNY